MKKYVMGALLLTSLSTTAFAANENVGCGLGTAVFGEPDSIIGQSFVVTTNGFYNLASFSMTSGTSECEYSSAFTNEKLNQFAAANMDEIALEIAKGEGEHLQTLAVMMGQKDYKTFVSRLQENFDAIYTHDNVQAAQFLNNIAAVLS